MKHASFYLRVFHEKGRGVRFRTLFKFLTWSDTNQGVRIRTEQIIDLK